ncbi:MAG: hypothetical protein LBL59_00005, partial [Xanthomonadaceae bacterium]|nr:hypothetical protein [Xanthomonadaceae bacterium]
MRRALGRNWSEFDREVGKTLSRLQEGGQEFIQSRQAANQHVKWLSLKMLTAVAASMAVLIGGGALLLTMELKRVHQAEARLESIEVRADVAEASRHVIITSCGGRPCIRLEADTPR